MIVRILAPSCDYLLILKSYRVIVIVRCPSIVQILPDGVPTLRRSVRYAHLLHVLVVVVHRHDLALLHDFVERLLIQVFNLVVVRFLVLLEIVAVEMLLLGQGRHFCQFLLIVLPCWIVGFIYQDVSLLTLFGCSHVFEGVYALVDFFVLVQRVQRTQRGKTHDGRNGGLRAVPLLSGGDFCLPIVVYGFSLLRNLVASSLTLDLEVLVRVQPLCCEIRSSLCLRWQQVRWPLLLLLLEVPVRRRRDASLVKWFGTTMSSRLRDLRLDCCIVDSAEYRLYMDLRLVLDLPQSVLLRYWDLVFLSLLHFLLHFGKQLLVLRVRVNILL